ncbi:hypothetical protein SEA_ALOEVERA_52 [Microbacterium phage AloeVera]
MHQQPPRLRHRNPTFLALTQRFRQLGVSYTLKRSRKKLLKEQRLLNLVEMEVRHRLLRLKELQQQQEMLQHRLEELSPRVSPALLSSFRSSTEATSLPKTVTDNPEQVRLSPRVQEFLTLPPKESTPPQ